MNTATFAKTVGLSLYEKPLKIEADKDEWPYKEAFTVGTMKDGSWQTYQFTGVGAANLTGELELVQFDEAEELDPIVSTAVKYTKGFVISNELEEDNRQIKGFLGAMGKSVGRAHR